jgi:hypothetical protein
MAAVMEPSWPGKNTLARVRAPRHPATSARRSSHYARAAHRQQAEMQLCILDQELDGLMLLLALRDRSFVLNEARPLRLLGGRRGRWRGL